MLLYLSVNFLRNSTFDLDNPLRGLYIPSLTHGSWKPIKNSSKMFHINTHKPVHVIYELICRLRILYTQLRRITLTTHVLPRLLAHVFAMASFSDLNSFFTSPRIGFTICYLRHPRQFAGSCKSTLPSIPHCCWSRVVFIPYVADSSLKSTRDRWLVGHYFTYKATKT